MANAINYQLSIFGNFTIGADPDTIATLMRNINKETNTIFLPNIISSQQIEIPSNKITTTSNIGFITQDQQYNIAILNERIDMNYNCLNGDSIELKSFYDLAIKAISAILDYSGTLSNRLAMNLQYVYEVHNYSALKERGKELLKNVSFYDGKDYVEWSMRTNSQIKIAVGESEEGVNVITDISSAENAMGGNPVSMFHIDINTLPLNKNMRFGKESLAQFVDNTMSIASDLITEIERLISNE